MTTGSKQDPTEGTCARTWTAPRLTELDISATQAGVSPNIQETVLTDASLAPS